MALRKTASVGVLAMIGLLALAIGGGLIAGGIGIHNRYQDLHTVCNTLAAAEDGQRQCGSAELKYDLGWVLLGVGILVALGGLGYGIGGALVVAGEAAERPAPTVLGLEGSAAPAGGIYVTSVAKGSIADAAGIKPGNRVAGITGHKINGGDVAGAWRAALLDLDDADSDVRFEVGNDDSDLQVLTARADLRALRVSVSPRAVARRDDGPCPFCGNVLAVSIPMAEHIRIAHTDAD
jgi:hypothetical protein